MAGQDQLIPPSTEPRTFQVSPLITPASVPAPEPVVNATPPSASQPAAAPASPQGSQTQSSADVGAGLLSDIFAAKKKTIDATLAAQQQNNAVDDAASQQVNTLFDSSMAAYKNLENIQKWSGFSGITKIMGLFDSDWNPEYQKTVLQANQVAAQQVADRAQTQKEINNRVPQMSALAGQLATEAYTTYSDYRKLQMQDIETRIDLQKANRQSELDAADNLSLEQKQQALAQARQGKGPFVGLEGILQKGIVQEQTAQTSLANLRLAVASGRDDLAQKELNTFTEHLPVSQLAPLVQQAMKNNQGVITLKTDTKGGVINIPLPVAQQALIKNQETETQLTQALAAQKTADLQIPKKINETVASAAALASLDPRAGHELSIVQNVLGTTDYKDINSVRQTGDALDASMARINKIADDVSKTYSRPEAQQAIKNYVAAGGVFDTQGAGAVVADTIGNFGLANTSKFKNAYGYLNQQAAVKIASQQNTGFDWSGSASPTMDAATAMSILNANKKMLANKTLMDNLLSDPSTNQALVNSITNTIRPQALITTIQSLAKDKGAAPIWGQLLQNPDSWSTNGAIDTRKLMSELEMQSAASAYKANYANALQARLQKYGVKADEAAAQDPSYTIADRALESHVFGARPQAAIVGTLYKELKVLGDTAHQEMKKRIQQDISGVDPSQTYAIPGQTTADINPKNTIPANKRASATGLPLSAAQIQAMFSNGVPQ